jgi:hypothetical protein
MPSVEIRVNQAELPDTLNFMREWFDHRKCNVAHFDSTTDRDGSVTINVAFDLADDATAFRRCFRHVPVA